MRAIKHCENCKIKFCKYFYFLTLVCSWGFGVVGLYLLFVYIGILGSCKFVCAGELQARSEDFLPPSLPLALPPRCPSFLPPCRGLETPPLSLSLPSAALFTPCRKPYGPFSQRRRPPLPKTTGLKASPTIVVGLTWHYLALVTRFREAF